jgi:phosphatidylinositol 4-kinase
VKLVQACAVERLAQTLKHFPTGDDVAMSTVHALLNTLYSHNSTTTNENPESQGQSILIQENVVVAISKIACAFDGDKVLFTSCLSRDLA